MTTRRFSILAVLAFAVNSSRAAPPDPRSIDLTTGTAPSLTVYAANVKTYDWTVRNSGATFNGTDYTPTFWWALSNRAPSIVTAACSWVTATSGVFRASFSASDLNYPAGGTMIYGVGVVSNGVTTARIGTFTIIPDPYATGAAPATFTTNFNWSLVNNLGVINGAVISNCVLYGNASGLTGLVAQVTNAVTIAENAAMSNALVAAFTAADTNLQGQIAAVTNGYLSAMTTNHVITNAWNSGTNTIAFGGDNVYGMKTTVYNSNGGKSYEAWLGSWSMESAARFQINDGGGTYVDICREMEGTDELALNVGGNVRMNGGTLDMGGGVITNVSMDSLYFTNGVVPFSKDNWEVTYSNAAIAVTNAATALQPGDTLPASLSTGSLANATIPAANVTGTLTNQLSSAYNLSLGTNAPIAWTNDGTTIVSVGTNLTVAAVTNGNVTTYTISRPTNEVYWTKAVYAPGTNGVYFDDGTNRIWQLYVVP